MHPREHETYLSDSGPKASGEWKGAQQFLRHWLTTGEFFAMPVRAISVT
jgi:hypothetical protein